MNVEPGYFRRIMATNLSLNILRVCKYASLGRLLLLLGFYNNKNSTFAQIYQILSADRRRWTRKVFKLKTKHGSIFPHINTIDNRRVVNGILTSLSHWIYQCQHSN